MKNRDDEKYREVRVAKNDLPEPMTAVTLTQSEPKTDQQSKTPKGGGSNPLQTKSLHVHQKMRGNEYLMRGEKGKEKGA